MDIYKNTYLHIEPYPTYIEYIPSLYYPYIKTMWIKTEIETKNENNIYKYLSNIENIKVLHNNGEKIIKYAFFFDTDQTNTVIINIDKYFNVKQENIYDNIDKLCYNVKHDIELFDKLYEYLTIDSKYSQPPTFDYKTEIEYIKNSVKTEYEKFIEIQTNLLTLNINKLKKNIYCITFISHLINVEYILKILSYIPETINTICLDFEIPRKKLKLFIKKLKNTSVKHLYFIQKKKIKKKDIVLTSIKIKIKTPPTNKDLLKYNKLLKLQIYNFNKKIKYTEYSPCIFSKTYKIYDKFIPKNLNHLSLGTNRNIYWIIKLNNHINLKSLDISNIWNTKILKIEFPPNLYSLYVNNIFLDTYINKELNVPETLDELYIKYNINDSGGVYRIPFRKKIKYIKLICVNDFIYKKYDKLRIIFVDKSTVYKRINYTNIYV